MALRPTEDAVDVIARVTFSVAELTVVAEMLDVADLLGDWQPALSDSEKGAVLRTLMARGVVEGSADQLGVALAYRPLLHVLATATHTTSACARSADETSVVLAVVSGQEAVLMEPDKASGMRLGFTTAAEAADRQMASLGVERWMEGEPVAPTLVSPERLAETLDRLANPDAYEGSMAPAGGDLGLSAALGDSVAYGEVERRERDGQVTGVRWVDGGAAGCWTVDLDDEGLASGRPGPSVLAEQIQALLGA